MDQTMLTPCGNDIGKRLDVFMAERVSLSRSAIQKLIDDDAVTVCGKRAEKNYRLREGDVIELDEPEPEPPDALPENIPLEIVYEDNSLIVVNKPKGMVVHPAAGSVDGTLVNALLYHCGDSLSGINGVMRPGIVHRIDKDTSGLLVVAKTDSAHLGLAEQIKAHTVERRYEAVVCGTLRGDDGKIDAPIGRHPVDRKRMAVVKGGREAVTHYKVIQNYNGYTHIQCRLETGRTHQIRVHMASIGHSVLGDPVYGRCNKFEKENAEILRGQCLHARTLGFIHPINGEQLLFTSELPDYFKIILDKLRKLSDE